jgi:hypothetical protein
MQKSLAIEIQPAVKPPKNPVARYTLDARPYGMEIPPTTELFPVVDLVARHPNMLNDSKVRWALRNRTRNGLAATGAVFEAKNGELLVREPVFLAWFLGLSGRNRPRAARQ